MKRKGTINFVTAVSVVIANMIGTGVFTSLGFQVTGIHSTFSILALWLTGGIVALCGALCYGELSAMMPRSGSEYHYLSSIYHPAVGFLSGWVSVTVGFAAPVALSAMLLGGYTAKVFPTLNETSVASLVLITLTVVHALSIRAGSSVQNIFTFLKVFLILGIVTAGFLLPAHQPLHIFPDTSVFSEIASPAFALSLYWVTYSYSGWNASSYIAGEIDNPQRNVPRSLFAGTLIVTLLYLLLNFIFLYAAPVGELAGQKEVGFIAAKYIFGEYGGKTVSLIIALLLVSSISSMILAGPRVAQVMGEDMPVLRPLARVNANGIPYVAILFQCAVSLCMIFMSAFESVLVYIGFTLNIFLLLTIAGLFVLRIKKPEAERPYRAWGYPVVPLVFMAVTLWVLYKGLEMKPKESLIGLATILSGLIVYFSGKKMFPGTQDSSATGKEKDPSVTEAISAS